MAAQNVRLLLLYQGDLQMRKVEIYLIIKVQLAQVRCAAALT